MSKPRQTLLISVGLTWVFFGILALASYIDTMPEPAQSNIIYYIMGATTALGLVLVAVMVSESINKKSRK
jgi:cytochrome c biogenesis protein CcdA